MKKNLLPNNLSGIFPSALHISRHFRQFILNVSLLTVTSVIMRTVAVGFNVFVTNRLGETGIGILSLIMSAYGFFTTLALSGVNLASSRLVADGLGHENPAEIRAAMRRCIGYAAFFGGLAALSMFLSADFIGGNIISDVRTIRSLKILAPSLLPLAISSSIYGYLHATRRVIKSATAQIAEQLIRIAVTVLALGIFLPKGLEFACFAVTLGITVSELAAFLYNYIIFRIDLSIHNNGSGKVPEKLTKKMLGISLPMAFSAYARSGLLTLEHMLIPIGLRRYGKSDDGAVAEYGILHGMAFPIILYPQVLLQSVSGLLVPEVAEECARGNREKIKNIAEKIIRLTLIFSVGAVGYMILFAPELGSVIYSNGGVSFYITVMAPLIPVMYLDSTVDGILKGLGEQIYSMRVNIIDSTVSVIMVWLFLPKYGIMGYIVTVYFCEILNGLLSLIRLLKLLDISFPFFHGTVVPAFKASLICLLLLLCKRNLLIFASSDIFSLTLESVAFVILYVTLTITDKFSFFRKRKKNCVKRHSLAQSHIT